MSETFAFVFIRGVIAALSPMPDHFMVLCVRVSGFV